MGGRPTRPNGWPRIWPTRAGVSPLVVAMSPSEPPAPRTVSIAALRASMHSMTAAFAASRAAVAAPRETNDSLTSSTTEIIQAHLYYWPDGRNVRAVPESAVLLTVEQHGTNAHCTIRSGLWGSDVQ